jgi:pyrophosphatase PpaX
MSSMNDTHERPEAILFDFDGTLADTTEMILQCYRHTMTTHLGECPGDERWLAGFGTPLETQMALFARTDEECAAMLETYKEHQRSLMEGMLIPFPGAVEAIAELERRGVRLAIVTSRMRRATLRGLDLCGLTRHFEVVVTPEDVQRPKPDPEPVRVALERLGVAPERAWFVGDSPHDVIAGQGAGVRTAAALWGPFPRQTLEEAAPDRLLSHVREVLALA